MFYFHSLDGSTTIYAQTPLPCETSMIRAWAVATSRRPWAGLTVCVYMDSSMRLAPVRCSVLLHSLLPTADACSSSSLSTTVIKFSIFSDPTRKLSALPPELRRLEYGNSKTTTLLPSAKRRPTRPLFQGRTGGGRPLFRQPVFRQQHQTHI